MKKETLKLVADVNGRIYQSEVDNYNEKEETEQITSCKRQIRKMLDEDGLADVQPDYLVEKSCLNSTRTHNI